MRAVTLTAALALSVVTMVARADPPVVGAAAPDIRCARSLVTVRDLMRDGAWFDAHAVAQSVVAICDDVPPEVVLWDAVALYRLDEPARAKRMLSALAAGDHPSIASRAAAISAWIDHGVGDSGSFSRSLAAVDPAQRSRLTALRAVGDTPRFSRAASALDRSTRSAAIGAHRRYMRARGKRPWLAGTLSAVIPGLGQAYAGAWEGAAVALAVNAVLIGATIELARHDLYFSAGATGTAASIFYVGNILNAADLAARRNDRESEAARGDLERVLVPEMSP